MAALSYPTAARIAFRELHSSRGKFTFVLLSVAIGVAALTGVRGFSASFRSMLTLQARSIMAGDLSARTSQQPSVNEQGLLDTIATNGVDQTQVIELSSMASSPTTLDPLLVAVKAIDPRKYPFYGSVTLSPSMPIADALTPGSVAVGDDLLMRLHMQVGDSIKLGNALFRIAATVQSEPDRLSGAFAAGPRVLISDEGLKAAGLMGFGSRASRRFLYKMPQSHPGQAASDKSVAALKAKLEAALPEASVQDYREVNPGITQALDAATSLLSLMSLVALVLGAVGVAMAMRAHLQQRLDGIAVMKSLGARSGQIMKIYALQTLMLGLAGGVLGVLLGLIVQMSFPLFLAKLLHVTPSFRVDPVAILLGIGAGLITTILFTLPPLLDIRGIRPILILRRSVEGEDDPFVERLKRKLRGNLAQIGATVLILVGLIFLAAGVAGSVTGGVVFSVALALILLVLLGMSALLLFLLRVFLSRSRLHLPSIVRHGLANLYRPGNPSAALLAALGLGVMLIAGVYFIQQRAVNDLNISVRGNLPNMFLVDIASSEVDSIRALLKTLPEINGEPELIPVIAARLSAVNGGPVPDHRGSINGNNKTPIIRRTNNANLTWTASPDQPPAGDKVVEGKWWDAAAFQQSGKQPIVAIGKFQAQRLGAHPGTTITFSVQDQEITAKVAAVYEADAQHAVSRAEYVFPQPVLADFPAVWYGGIHCDPKSTAKIERALYSAFPTVTVINVANTVEIVRLAILQVTYVIQFLAAFSIFAGIVILASAIAGTRYRRIREVVVLKTLGATRPRIATIFSIEFAVLGLVAASVGLIFANLGSGLFLKYTLKIDYHFQPLLTLLILGITATLTVAAGWLASHRVLGQKPLEILREQ